MTITLGSLFDGIGVLPLAASRHGITPVWASEIVPENISITKRHFPEMAHLGDINHNHRPCRWFALAPLGHDPG